MTNPDTNTLNGALEQLGITMADNLVTMGVSDADPSDGLTTLASKILEISPVPQSFDGVSLTSDKSILSYADSEYATLSAQLTSGGSAAAVSGETVTFTIYKDSDDSVVDTLTADTNSSGVATVSYYGQGTGDLYIQAECTFVSEIFVLEDCLFYDSAASDKTSKYSTLNVNSFTHSNNEYIAVRTLGESPTNTFYSPIYLDDFTLPSDYEVSVDISTSTVSQEMLNIVSSPVQTYSGATEFGVLSTGLRYGLFKRISGTGTFYTTSGKLNANEYYNFKVRVNGTSVTGIITDSNGVQKHTNTQSISQASDFDKFTIVNGGKAHTVKFRNIKVKPL